jgi:hypothetical protein
MRSKPQDQVGGFGLGTFSAYRSASGSVATGGIILFEAEEFDTDDWYDVDTGIYFPKAPGIYHFSWAVNAGEAGASGNFWTAPLYKNTVQFKNGQLMFSNGSAPFPVSGGSAYAFADGVADQFNVGVIHNMGASRIVAGGSYCTFFQAHAIRQLGR